MGVGMVVDSPVAGGESNEASLSVPLLTSLWLGSRASMGRPCLHWAAGCLYPGLHLRWAVARLAQAYPAPCTGPRPAARPPARHRGGRRSPSAARAGPPLRTSAASLRLPSSRPARQHYVGRWQPSAVPSRRAARAQATAPAAPGPVRPSAPASRSRVTAWLVSRPPLPYVSAERWADFFFFFFTFSTQLDWEKNEKWS